MRLIDRLRPTPEAARADLPEWQNVYTTSYQQGTTESLLPVFTSFASDGYKGNSIVFSVILARLMLFSEAEFKFQNLTDKRLFGTGELALLENPWPGGTTGDLLARMEQDVSLAGSAFVRHCGDQLERLRPDWVDIVADVRSDYSRQVVGYIYRRNAGQNDGSTEFYTTAEVAHWSPIPDPLASWRGMSWLTPVVREVNADSAMTTHKRAFFDNAATPNMIIKYAQKLNDDAIEKLSAQWQATHGGPRNGWKTAVLDNGADPTIIGHSFEQMNFATVQAAGENRIAAAAGVPGIVVGLKEGLQAATYSNYEQAMRRFSDLTMRPLWRSATAALATLINVPSGTRLWYDTAGIAALRQGEMERAQTFKEKAFTATELIRGGYDPDTVASAVDAGDLSLLQHTGAVPTALYPDGKTPATGGTT
ncbi:MAG: phage portal protein [Candidatus Microthrix sp.]|nr:phage portal protein [Candidatus Microthrix sp.]